MRKRRKPPNICIKLCNNNTSNYQKSNCKIKIENKISKRPVSNGIRSEIKLPNLPKRNRAFLILFCRMKC